MCCWWALWMVLGRRLYPRSRGPKTELTLQCESHSVRACVHLRVCVPPCRRWFASWLASFRLAPFALHLSPFCVCACLFSPLVSICVHGSPFYALKMGERVWYERGGSRRAFSLPTNTPLTPAGMKHAACCVLLRAAACCAACVLRYHVNQANYSVTPTNMNTADIRGDIYFAMTSRALPIECTQANM